MKYDPQLHHRRSIRLKGYDYSSAGAYFVTVCTNNRECLFGDIREGKMVLNECGEIVSLKWKNIPAHFGNVELDEFVIMPNHIHGIIIIVDTIVGAKHSLNASPLHLPLPLQYGTSPGSLPAIMQNFQSVTTRKINQIRCSLGNKFWQRNYYEHVIRNEKELNALREYIVNNPLKWDLDKDNPINM